MAKDIMVLCVVAPSQEFHAIISGNAVKLTEGAEIEITQEQLATFKGILLPKEVVVEPKVTKVADEPKEPTEPTEPTEPPKTDTEVKSTEPPKDPVTPPQNPPVVKK